MASLGHPERHFAAVHVGGTNGKGSVSTLLAEILRAGGWRVGLYTSPHLVSFRERVMVDGVAISEDAVTLLGGRAWRSRPSVSAPRSSRSATALAFADFAARGVEVAVVEVGLGGPARRDQRDHAAGLRRHAHRRRAHRVPRQRPAEHRAGEGGDRQAGRTLRHDGSGRGRRRRAAGGGARARGRGRAPGAREPPGAGRRGRLRRPVRRRRRRCAATKGWRSGWPARTRRRTPCWRCGSRSWPAPRFPVAEAAVRAATPGGARAGALRPTGEVDLRRGAQPGRGAGAGERARAGPSAATTRRGRLGPQRQGVGRDAGDARGRRGRAGADARAERAGDRAWDLDEVSRWARERGIAAAVEPDFAGALDGAARRAATVLVTGSFHTVGDAMSRLPGAPPLG